ncbi:hypothetical protein V6N13_130214 [Hibiscus sabdariffa]|uniref:Uncharacterized protein n=1 Tax=Hibiscus sabdariffa TaxID=183260 RepID=A0ABR2SNF2_9ROSI
MSSENHGKPSAPMVMASSSRAPDEAINLVNPTSLERHVSALQEKVKLNVKEGKSVEIYVMDTDARRNGMDRSPDTSLDKTQRIGTTESEGSMKSSFRDMLIGKANPFQQESLISELDVDLLSKDV